MVGITDVEAVHAAAASILRSIDGKPFDERVMLLADVMAKISDGLILAAQIESTKLVTPIMAKVNHMMEAYKALADVADAAAAVAKPYTAEEIAGTGACGLSTERYGAIMKLREALARAELATRPHGEPSEARPEAG